MSDGKVVNGNCGEVPDGKIDCRGLLIAPGLIDLQVAAMLTSLSFRLIQWWHLFLLSNMPNAEKKQYFEPCINFQINGAFGEDFTSGNYILPAYQIW